MAANTATTAHAFTGRPEVTKNDLARYYALRANEYDAIYMKPERQVDIHLLGDAMASLLEGRSVLELACGTGRILIPIAKLGYQTVGIDLSQSMLDVFAKKIANDKILSTRIKLVCSDMANFSLGQKFDFIFISNILFELRNLYPN